MNKPNYFALITANVRYDNDLSPNAKLLYGEITALSNAQGFCWATNAYFADLYKVTKRSVQLWLSQLEEKGYIRTVLSSEGPNDSTRKIYIVSPHEEIFAPPRKNVHEGDEKNFTPPHEENFTLNNTSINNTINNTSNKKNSSTQIEKEFEKLWAKYPRKIGKKKAFDSFKKARKVKKVPYEVIESGLYRYLKYIDQQELDEQYIQHGSTFFNQEKWQDEFICTGVNKKPKNMMDMYRMEFGGKEDEFRGNAQVFDYHESGLSEFL